MKIKFLFLFVLSFTCLSVYSQFSKNANGVTIECPLANVGDTRTLVIHPASATHSQMDEATLKFAGLSHDMIRLSVGIEDIDDIKNDFEAGFRAARKPRLVSNQ